jgi:hypothetical protein
VQGAEARTGIGPRPAGQSRDDYDPDAVPKLRRWPVYVVGVLWGLVGLLFLGVLGLTAQHAPESTPALKVGYLVLEGLAALAVVVTAIFFASRVVDQPLRQAGIILLGLALGLAAAVFFFAVCLATVGV